MSDESLYHIGKEVGALQQQVGDLRTAADALAANMKQAAKDLADQVDEHDHGELERALETAGVIEWVEEDSCWRVVPAVVAIVRPDKAAEEQEPAG